MKTSSELLRMMVMMKTVMRKYNRRRRSDTVTLRYMLCFILEMFYYLFRRSVILGLKSELRRQGPGGDLAQTMTAIKGSPEAYLEYMKVQGCFADQIFLLMLASLLQTDIILLPVHARDGSVEKNYIRLPEGIFGSEESGTNQTIFMAYYKEHEFLAGHYQAMEPVTNGPVVQDIHLKGGLDIAAALSLPDHLGRPTFNILIFYSFFFLIDTRSLPSNTASFSPGANSTLAITPASKRNRSPSPPVTLSEVVLTPPPPTPECSPTGLSSASLSALRKLLPTQFGVSWIEVGYYYSLFFLSFFY